MSALPYIYRWDRHGRKGQPCEVLVRANVSCLVFSDGCTMVTSRNALIKGKVGSRPRTVSTQSLADPASRSVEPISTCNDNGATNPNWESVNCRNSCGGSADKPVDNGGGNRG